MTWIRHHTHRQVVVAAWLGYPAGTGETGETVLLDYLDEVINNYTGHANMFENFFPFQNEIKFK